MELFSWSFIHANMSQWCQCVNCLINLIGFWISLYSDHLLGECPKCWFETASKATSWHIERHYCEVPGLLAFSFPHIFSTISLPLLHQHCSDSRLCESRWISLNSLTTNPRVLSAGPRNKVWTLHLDCLDQDLQLHLLLGSRIRELFLFEEIKKKGGPWSQTVRGTFL